MKKIFCSLIFFLFLFVLPTNAAENVDVYFFYSETCPHCHEEQQFLNTLLDIDLHAFEVTKYKENQQLLSQVAKALQVSVGGVPFTVISDQYIIGYQDDASTGEQIRQMVQYCQTQSCPDVVASLQQENAPSKINSSSSGKNISLPYFGTIDLQQFSLPMIAVLLGFVDGFNPCAMWVLIFLITLLFGMENKKRMWVLGLTFLFVSAFVYFLFLAAWLNFFLFIGYIFWIRIIIGIVAIAAALYHLKDWYERNELVCKVVTTEKRKKVFERIKDVIQKHSLFWALIGIAILAFSVNLVELICSAGLPALFTQILALSHLSVWQYYGLLLLYILMYMIDDMIVFGIAMATLQITGTHAKYVRAANLIGGIILLILGILLIFIPEWLSLG